MIVGAMNAQREAIVRLVVVGPGGQQRQIEAVLDTGYTGSLTLPSVVVSALHLPFRGRGSVVLGDGSESEFDIHEATVTWQASGVWLRSTWRKQTHSSEWAFCWETS